MTRWAILGAGVISRVFAEALADAPNHRLVAVGSTAGERARVFANDFGAEAGAYADVFARDDLDAVYIGTIHPTHHELLRHARAAGLAALCEKPLTMSEADTQESVDAAAESGTVLIEAFKYRFVPLFAAVADIISSGGIGEVTEIHSSRGFVAPSRSGRLFDRALGGGVILDTGCYPASLAIAVAAAAGADLSALRRVGADVCIGDTGVDERASAQIDIDGITTHLRCSMVEETSPASRILGTRGTIDLPDIWGARTSAATEATLTVGGARSTLRAEDVDPFRAEADALARALADGSLEVPEMPWEQSVATARVLDLWRR